MGKNPPPPIEPPDGHIGRKAVEMGLITAGQLADVLLQMSRAGDRTLLATTLVARGLLTQAQIGVISDLAKGGPPKRVGKYHIVRELGRGGMGIVYEAQDPALGRRVALKTLLTDFNVADETRKLDEERFLREARLSANLPKHPHIVGVYEAGAEDDVRFIAMEYIEGRQFSEWRKTGPPRRQQVTVLRDAALAVEHAHRHGVIHRDLKPANILVDADNSPHVTDFGLAKRGAAEQSLALTVTGEVMGTPAYMSPEQAEGKKDLDLRSDIWSLGIMLYEILTGRVPFEAETPLKLIMKTVKDPVTPPSAMVRATAPGSVDASIEAICMKALSKDPNARHASAREFADDLSRWLKGPRTGVVPARTKPAPKPKTWIFAGIGAAAAVAIAILAVVGSSSPSFDADEYLAQGQKLLAEGNPSGALIKFGRVLEEDPGNRAAAAGKKEAERRLVAAARPTPEAPRPPTFAKELAELDTLLASLQKAENFGTARDLLSQAGGRHEGAEWRSEIAKRNESLKKAVQDLFAQVAAEAEAAKRTDLALEVDARKSRVKQWNWPGLTKDLDDALAKVAPAPPPPPKDVGPVAPVLMARPALGHPNAVHSIGISPDGKSILTSCFDGLVRLWDPAGRTSIPLTEKGNQSTSAAMSPDGKWLAAGFWDGHVTLWDAAKLQSRTLSGHTLQVLGLVFTADSKQLLSASTDGAVRLWDVSGGTSKLHLMNHPKGAMSVAVAMSGKMAAVGSAEQILRLWEIPSGRDVGQMVIGLDACLKVAFMPDGKSVIGGFGKGDVTQWDVLTGTPRVFGSHPQLVRGLAISPDGRWVASTSAADGIKIWDAASAILLDTIQVDAGFFGVAFSPKGDLLVGGGGDHQLRIWEITGVRPKSK